MYCCSAERVKRFVAGDTGAKRGEGDLEGGAGNL
jgi:hypothetical protein